MKAPEPSGPIQLIPPGLLGLLQLKSPAGQNPTVLNADVQPSIELLPWWLRANRQVWGPNSGINLAAGAYENFQGFSPNSIIVPENQWWYVHSYTVSIESAAGGSALASRLAMQFNQTGTLKYRALGFDGYDFFDSTYGRALLHDWDFWVPPGAQLGIYVGDVAVAALDVVLRGLDYTICPI